MKNWNKLVPITRRIKDLFSDRMVFIGMDDSNEPMYTSKREETIMKLYTIGVGIVLVVLIIVKLS